MDKNLLAALLFYVISLPAQIDSSALQRDSLDFVSQLPVLNEMADEGESAPEQQDISSLLLSSRDVFIQFSAMHFSAVRFRPRGLSAENTQVSVNGVIVNSPETGYASWSSWGGLNDVTVFAENRFGNIASRYGFSGPAGYVNLDTRAASYKKSTRLTVSNGNRTYRQRLMITRHSGMLQNGWAFSAAASLRQGKNIYTKGTWFSGQSFFLSADKRSGNHLIGFTGFFSPAEQGRSAAHTLETYDLAGTNYYNKNVGLQQGRLRNASVSKTARPMLIVSDVFEKNAARITTSAFYSFGKSRMSGISFHNAPNPDPAYYRNLPSYHYQRGDTVTGDLLTWRWQNDEAFRLLDWDRMIRMNQANLYSDPHLLGQGINTSETRARYIVEDRVESLSYSGINSVLNKRMGKTFLSAGLEASAYSNRKYKEVNDLLGADFWLDVDQFAEDLGVEESIQQNDLDNPNKKVRTGDRFGYDYAIGIKKAGGWMQVETSGHRLEYYAGLMIGTVSTQRTGFVANGKFPENSRGESARVQFLNAGVKGGLVYKLTGRHFINVNAQAQQRNPESALIFISPRVRNDVAEGLQPEKVYSGDLGYHIKYATLKARLTFYHTRILDQAWLRTYWHDSYNTMVNLMMTDVDQVAQGLELGLEKTIRVSHLLQFAFGYGEFFYMNNPRLQAWQDNTSQPVFKDRKTYLSGYRVGGSPQLVAGAGYKYTSRKYWFSGINMSYMGERFLEPNPDRRTAEATAKYLEDEKSIAERITVQEKMPDVFLVNVNAGKSWRIKRKFNLNAGLSINNLLNNRSVLSGGYESLRWDQNNIEKFQPKYTYMQGISYMLNVACSF